MYLLLPLPFPLLDPHFPPQWVDAEAWQMGLYGPGGHYLPHLDTLGVSDTLPVVTTNTQVVTKRDQYTTHQL